MLLGLHLAHLGVGPGGLGMLVGAGLAGTALGTAVAALAGERLGRRRSLLWATGLGAFGLAWLAVAPTPVVLVIGAFLGMVNGMGRDRGPAQVLEQSWLADGLRAADRTRAFVRYTVIQDVAGAVGALGAGIPALLERVAQVPLTAGARGTFLALAAVALVPLALYRRLEEPVPSARAVPGPWWRVPLAPRSRQRVGGLTLLFGLDSVGGGFLAGSILSYWFFRQFGLSGATLGPLFFGARGLNALSYLGAERLARRVGLVRTMVFTHLPSNAVLLALPLLENPAPAVLLFLVREALVQMDVPARQSYVAAVTAPGERTVALGLTGLVRNLGWAVGPPLAGAAMATAGLAAPLVIGAALKMVYDVALFASFRRVHAPEERASPSAS